MGQARQRKLSGEYPEPTPSQWATDRVREKREKKGISPTPLIYALWASMTAKFSTRHPHRPASYADVGGLR